MNKLARRIREEDGVSAVIVAVALVALLGGSMLSVDAGSVWKTRRALITDTDAGALAAARYLDANGEQACAEAQSAGPSSAAGAEAEYVMKENDPGSWLDGFEASPFEGDCSSEAGHVRVGGRLPAHLTFAPVFGIENLNAFSSSTAQYGPLVSTTGLRPIAICDKNEHFREWARHLNGDDAGWGAGDGHPAYPEAVVHRVYFQKGSSGCGEAAGNWDWLDFNGNKAPNGSAAVLEWLRYGYNGVVSIGDEATGVPRDCDAEEPGDQEPCAPQTGALAGSVEEALRYLRDSKLVFPIVVYDRVVDERDPQGCETPPPWTGSGNNARFCPVAFLLVRVHGWGKITGQTKDDSYFDFEFIDQWWVGQVGGDPAEGRPSTHGVQLCGGNYGTTTDTKCDV